MMNNLCEANFEIKVDELTNVISYLILVCIPYSCIHRIVCFYHICKENQIEVVHMLELLVIEKLHFLTFSVRFLFFAFWFFLRSVYLLLAVLGLCCCVQAFYSCSKCGASLHCDAWAAHCGGLFC